MEKEILHNLSWSTKNTLLRNRARFHTKESTKRHYWLIHSIQDWSRIKSDTALIKQLPDKIHHNDKAKSDRDFTFHLYCADRTYILAAIDKSELFQWISYLKSCIYGNIIKQGWLKKQGNVNKNWKKRYFVANKYQQLKYYEDDKMMKFSGVIDCKQISSVNNGKSYNNDIQHTLELHTKQRVWIIAAVDDDERVKECISYLTHIQAMWHSI